MRGPTLTQMWDEVVKSHENGRKAEYLAGYGIGYENGYNKAVEDLTKIMGFETILEDKKPKKK